VPGGTGWLSLGAALLIFLGAIAIGAAYGGSAADVDANSAGRFAPADPLVGLGLGSGFIVVYSATNQLAGQRQWDGRLGVAAITIAGPACPTVFTQARLLNAEGCRRDFSDCRGRDSVTAGTHVAGG
jgi:hypothetical protein